MTTFNPGRNHCPQSCLCPMCLNDDDCEEPCIEYKQMARGCEDTECGMCKVDFSNRVVKE